MSGQICDNCFEVTQKRWFTIIRDFLGWQNGHGCDCDFGVLGGCRFHSTLAGAEGCQSFVSLLLAYYFLCGIDHEDTLLDWFSACFWWRPYAVGCCKLSLHSDVDGGNSNSVQFQLGLLLYGPNECAVWAETALGSGSHCCTQLGRWHLRFP